MGVAA